MADVTDLYNMLMGSAVIARLRKKYPVSLVARADMVVADVLADDLKKRGDLWSDLASTTDELMSELGEKGMLTRISYAFCTVMARLPFQPEGYDKDRSSRWGKAMEDAHTNTVHIHIVPLRGSAL